MPGRGMVIDVAELERFIDTLQHFDAELADSVRTMSSHFATLGEVWHDDEFRKFAATWDQAMHAMQRYIDDSPGYVQYLHRKAGIARSYGR